MTLLFQVQCRIWCLHRRFYLVNSNVGLWNEVSVSNVWVTSFFGVLIVMIVLMDLVFLVADWFDCHLVFDLG